MQITTAQAKERINLEGIKHQQVDLYIENTANS